MRPLGVLLAAAAFCLAPSLGAWGQEAAPPSTNPAPPRALTASLEVEGVSALRFEGFQALGVDGKGRAYLFDPIHYSAIPLFGPAAEREAQRLTREEPKGSHQVRSAALSKDGSTWVVLTGTTVALLEDQKEEILDHPPFVPESVAMLGDEPVVLVRSQPMGMVPQNEEGPEHPPLALRWTGRAWETVVEDDPLTEAEVASSGERMVSREAIAFGDSRGRLWVANRNRYRVREYSPAGRVLTTITVGGGKVEHIGESEATEAEAALLAEMKKAGLSEEEISQGSVWVNTAKPVIAAIAEGRDGRMYFLVHAPAGEGAPAGFALDRYDPVELVLERARLRLDFEGRVGMVGGQDALYFAAPRGEARSRALLPWEACEEADWRPVEGAEIGGATPQ